MTKNYIDTHKRNLKSKISIKHFYLIFLFLKKIKETNHQAGNWKIFTILIFYGFPIYEGEVLEVSFFILLCAIDVQYHFLSNNKIS